MWESVESLADDTIMDMFVARDALVALRWSDALTGVVAGNAELPAVEDMRRDGEDGM
jgi:hypothetical protein